MMFQKIRESRLMFWSLEALIIVGLIIGLTNLSFLFKPIATFFSTLLIPFIAAGFLFYLFNRWSTGWVSSKFRAASPLR